MRVTVKGQRVRGEGRGGGIMRSTHTNTNVEDTTRLVAQIKSRENTSCNSPACIHVMHLSHMNTGLVLFQLYKFQQMLLH